MSKKVPFVDEVEIFNDAFSKPNNYSPTIPRDKKLTNFVVDFIKEETGGMGCEVVFEAAGTHITTQQTVDCVKPGGTVVVIGICQEDVIPMNFGNSRRREITYKFVRRYKHVFPRSIDLVATGRIDTDSLVTHNFPFDQITEAFQTAREARDNALKVTVEVGEGMD